MVPRDHDRPDARRAASGDGLADLIPGRIDHGDQADERQVGFDRFGIEAARLRLEHAGGHAEDAEGLIGQLPIDRGDLGEIGLRHRPDVRAVQDPAAEPEKDVGSALDEGDLPTALRIAADDGHPFPLGIEGDLLDQRVAGQEVRLAQAGFGRRADERALGRVPEDFISAVLKDKLGVVGEDRSAEGFEKVRRRFRIDLPAVPGKAARGLVSRPGNVVQTALDVHGPDGHLVPGQGPGRS